jgi:plastocyanin
MIWKNLHIAKWIMTLLNSKLVGSNSTVKGLSAKDRRLIFLVTALACVGAVALLLVPAVSAQETATTGSINTNVANVNIVSGAQNPNNGLFYSPQSITVVMGVNNTVVWTNNDNVMHTVVANDNSYSGTLNPGDTFAHTFTAAGVYDYHCSIHSFMTGSVTVLAAPSSSTAQGGIPEFPFQAVAVIVLTALVLVSYLALRQNRRG